MPYTSRETGPILTDEERDVAASLCDYSTEGTTGRDWTPIASLWRCYCDWWAVHRWRIDPDAPDKLTLRQFGHAMRRIFPGVHAGLVDVVTVHDHLTIGRWHDHAERNVHSETPG